MHQVNNIKAEAMQIVTVPVRGIRLHQKQAMLSLMKTLVTVPVRGIRLHRQNHWPGLL